MDLHQYKFVHFVGIGGIGVSALARMFLLEGKKVSGSDVADSPVVKELKKLGAKISLKHHKNNLPKKECLVIYTKAVGEDNPEIKEAKKRNFPLLSYSQALGEISSKKYTIAVSGAHGKTTTTGMIAFGLIKAKKNPTVVIGSFLKDLHSNFVAGRGKYFVAEACEYKRSFLDLNPQIIVITNIDNDHLDYYKDIGDIRKAFEEFIAKLPKDGYLVCDLNDKNSKIVSQKCQANIIDYSKEEIKSNLKIFGDHNTANAKAALAVLRILGVKSNLAQKSLALFGGTSRRMELKGEKNGVLVYDDYAHHPTEIKATLKALRNNYQKNRIFCVFQPHLFSRTKLLLDDFASSFGGSDKLALLPIYAAREKFDSSISHLVLLKKIGSQDCHPSVSLAFPDFPQVLKFLKNNLKKGDVLVTMGAGDVYKIGDIYLNN